MFPKSLPVDPPDPFSVIADSSRPEKVVQRGNPFDVIRRSSEPGKPSDELRGDQNVVQRIFQLISGSERTPTGISKSAAAMVGFRTL